MSSVQDDSKRLREVDVALGVELSQAVRDPSPGMPCLLAQTTTISSYPSSAQNFYACTPLSVLGAEDEGGQGTITPGSSTFLALNLGTAVPPAGSKVLATFVDNRWVFRFDG
jgi:hypothetical protein